MPTVLVLNAALTGIASETARVVGRPDLAIVQVARSLFGRPRAAIATVAEPLGPEVERAIVHVDG